MKLFRRLSAFTMVLALLLSMSLSVLAADYDAATVEDLFTAFGDTSGEDVNINVTADIDGEHYVVQAQEGINYSISSENGSTVGNVGFYGEGSVDVNTDVSGDLYAMEGAEVSVNGDVSGNVDAYNEGSVAVEGDVGGNVYAADGAEVTVGGNVADGVGAYFDSSVTVEGDVGGYISTQEGSSVTVGGDVADGVNAYLDSSVTVEGDVGGFVDAFDGGSVTVGGDVGDGVWVGSDSEVTVGGNVDGSVSAYGSANVTVDGDVSGTDGDPDSVDYSDPYGYSDGGMGVYADEEATVTVGGNVSGGDAYGSFAYGGTGVAASGNATVTVGGNVSGGNVTADPETETENWSMGGTAIQMSSTATVTVGGNASGGDTNGYDGVGGNGILVIYESGEEPGSVTVAGDVTSGAGEQEGSGIVLYNNSEAEAPEIVLGSCDTIEGYGFTEEELAQIKADIEANLTKNTVDTFLADVLWLVRNAQPGDEITVNAGFRQVITKTIIEAVRECEVTLIIKWRGGDDLVIDKTFTAEFEAEYIHLSEIAELLKK